MRKRFLLISTIIVLSAFTFAACGKKSPSSPESTNSETTTAEPTTEENTEKDTTEEEKPVPTATSEESTKEQTKTTTATKKDEQAKPSLLRVPQFNIAVFTGKDNHGELRMKHRRAHRRRHPLRKATSVNLHR